MAKESERLNSRRRLILQGPNKLKSFQKSNKRTKFIGSFNIKKLATQLHLVIALSATSPIISSEINFAELTEFQTSNQENNIASIAGKSTDEIMSESDINQLASRLDRCIKSNVIEADDISQNTSKKSSSHHSISTSYFAYQYTTDGWLQHIGVYADSIICTNLEGPREGVQFIISNNSAVIDMCHDYSSYKDHFKHKYTWGDVKTYNNHQIVTFK